jgi:adenylate cyclase
MWSRPLRLPRNVRLGRFYLPVVCLFLALAVAGRIADPFFVQALRLIAFDTYQRLDPQAYDPAIPVRVVDIDEESLKRHGQWPWPRTLMRDLVAKLTEQKAAAIAFDILFADADQNSPEQILKRLPPAQASRIADALGGEANDQAFAKSLDGAPVVLPIILNNRPAGAPFTPKAGVAVAGDDPRPFLRAFTGSDRNLPFLDQAAPGVGALNWIPNRDQVVRRAPMFMRLGDTIVPSLTAEALRVAQGASTYVVKSSNASGETALGRSTGLNAVRIGDIEFPIDADGAITLKFRDSNPAAFIPAWKVLAGTADASEIAGKIMLVGTSTPGLLDLRATPLDEGIAGVEIHAMAIEHILAGRHLTRVDYAVAVEEFAIIGLGLLLAFVLPRLAPGLAAGLGAAIFIALNLGGWLAYRYADLQFDPFYPALALLLLTAGITFHIYRQTEHQRGAIRVAFGRYLAPEVVADIVANPGRLELGGEVRELTLMFCDVRNFTSISEGLTAAELTHFINELLTPLSDIILHQRGTIDKYMGDAIMAFWNAPLSLPDHAARACNSAVAMVARMDDLNTRWRQAAEEAGKPFRPVRIGIGINTGECCVGNLGSEQRFDYSAIGDEVNVTSRLEGLTKFYGLSAVASENTILESKADALELDLILVKGRATPTRIFALADLLECDADTLARLRPLHADFIAAYRARQWDRAEALIAQCRACGCAALEVYYGVFSERVAALRTANLAVDWNGAYAMTEK